MSNMAERKQNHADVANIADRKNSQNELKFIKKQRAANHEKSELGKYVLS